MKMFNNHKEPTMNELVNYLQVNFPKLVDDMNNSNHSYQTNEPNPYHIENSVWTHTMMVCLQAENNSGNKIVLISALLHDLGKPLSRGVIPFKNPKPVFTDSNEIRENDKKHSKTKGLNREWKVHFRGHEGISFYKAYDVIKDLILKGVLNTIEAKQILTIICLHGTLFDSIKDGEEYKPEKVLEKWKLNPEYFENFIAQVKNDSSGRFFTSLDGRKNTSSELGKSLYGKDFVNRLNIYKEYKGTEIIPKNSITLLVGVPCSGKSTYLENMCYSEGNMPVIISRDTLVEKMGIGRNYSEKFKSLTPELHKEIDILLQKNFQTALKDKMDIIVDMTNTSPKSRRKWLSQVSKDYYKKAIVFATGYEEIIKRNEKRNEKTGKFIPLEVITGMMSAFTVPTGAEFDHIEFIFDL